MLAEIGGYLRGVILTHLCQIAAFRHSFDAGCIALQNRLQMVEPDDLAAENHLLGRSLVGSLSPLCSRRTRRGRMCAPLRSARS